MAVLLAVLAVPAVSAQADAERDAQWHLAFLDMARVHQVSQGAGVTVAVIDSGVNGNHPDLTGNVLQGESLLPGHPGNGWADIDGHGTAMAADIAAHGHDGGGGVLGIAPQAKIFPIQVMTGGDHGTPDIDAAAIDAAVGQGARVISMSIGDAISLALSEAVARAQQADVVIVAAAGNKPDDIVTWPAHYDGVVAVAAVDRNGNHADISVTGRQVLVAAPGVDIESASTGGAQYLAGTGTSDSTAITAGVVALIRSRFPTMSATEVIHRLTATATDKGPKGRDEEYGYGIVNPYAALTANIPPLATSASPTASPTPSGLAQSKPPSTKKTGPILAIILAAIAVPTIALAIIIGRTRRRTT